MDGEISAALHVGIVFSDEYRHLVSCSPKFLDRFTMVMDLINAYGLVRHLVRISPLVLSSKQEVYREISVFHSVDYLDALAGLQAWHEDKSKGIEPDDPFLDSFGLSYDCPGFPHVFDYSVAAVTGSLAAAEALLQGHCQVAINWAGGWHHAKRTEASGFCYLNDIVLAIHRLLENHLHKHRLSHDNSQLSDRILYIDLDLHHGDGVEEAFWYSPRVVTFSVHHAAPGFFPGTGTSVASDEGYCTFPNGAGRGRFAAFNMPLADGVDDPTWSKAVLPMLNLLYALVHPAFVVVQCGADGLCGDPHRVFNLTNLDPNYLPRNTPIKAEGIEEPDPNRSGGSYVTALRRILSWKVPTLILGGGGYNFPDTARLWTRLTAVAIEETSGLILELDSTIPDHSLICRYGPGFDLDISNLPKINRCRDEDIIAHHTRLLKQAVLYAEFNNLTIDRTQLERTMADTGV
ncbi:histone deacetylase 8 [Clonorchis sinensis]|uniref:histone deacetylase n=1 Tax=Clonorchis sinensis TaxID=79923 RepID=G7YN86_CLOSI|nr:histone deacetylase 8 [Clonorchis sinensis]